MMTLCIIPARGGSQRIPRKNIKLFQGKPMIAYSVETALQSGCFERVIVSTDDEEIAKIAQALGADVPFLRPKELANDNTATLPVIKHTLEWCAENEQLPTYACCLYATAPFIKAQYLQNALQQLITTGAEYCFSATRFPFPIQRAIKLTEQGRVQMFQPEYFNTRSQDLEEAYHDAGQFYWGKTEAFLAEKIIFSESATAYLLPQHRVQDIDTPEDWQRAELMFQVLQQEVE